MKKYIVVIILLVSAVCMLVYALRAYRISRLFGGTTYAKIISAPDGAELFKTSGFLSKLTNGAPPDQKDFIYKAGEGVTLPNSTIDRIRVILLDPASYGDPGGDAAPPAPELVISMRRGKKTVDLCFSDEFRDLTVISDGTWRSTLHCEPIQQELEKVVSPYLSERPPSWRRH